MTRAVNTAAVGIGGVIQVQSTTKTNVFTTTSTTFVDVTGLSVSITPTSATSRILVMAYYVLSNANGTANYYAFSRVMRDATPLFVGDASGSRLQATSQSSIPTSAASFPTGVSFVDSPATTSTITYKIQVASESGGTAELGAMGGDANQTNFARFPSSITLMEIAG